MDSPTPDAIEDKQSAYIGNELELFQLAVNWKRYLASRMRPFINGDVLEVGAGLGANVQYSFRDDLNSWVSLEPDERLCDEFRRRQSEGLIPEQCRLTQGTLEALPAADAFDSILYIDVLEHIEDDKTEFEHAWQRLKPGGHLVVLCPAHGMLYSPFDKAIGHFRRYNKRMYRELSVHHPLRLDYLDSVGLLASIANKLMLRQTYPNKRQISLWDGLFVRMSTAVDPLTLRTIGKSILGIWGK